MPLSGVALWLAALFFGLEMTHLKSQGGVDFRSFVLLLSLEVMSKPLI
jgi:hypothetical protein